MKNSLFGYKTLFWLLFAVFGCFLFGDIQSRLPGGREVLIQKRFPLAGGNWQITVRQHYEIFTEPYRVVVEIANEANGLRWEEQIAFEELKWDGECVLRSDASDGTISIIRGEELFAILNLRDKWMIDRAGHKQKIMQERIEHPMGSK